MEKKFSGKVALITGAAGSLGRGLVEIFSQRGADLILLDMNEEMLLDSKRMAEKNGVRAEIIVCDISNEADVTEKITAAEVLFGKIDILVNNAAVFRCKSEFEN